MLSVLREIAHPPVQKLCATAPELECLIFLIRLLYPKTELWGDGCVVTLNCVCLE